MEKQTRVGVAAIIKNDKGEVLLGLRKSAHASGTWGFPGGHLEFNETPEDCIAREVKEETGLRVIKATKADYTNDIYPDEGKHYITLFYSVTCADGTPEVREPDKCERWEWFNEQSLPKNLMLPIIHLYKQGVNPFVS